MGENLLQRSRENHSQKPLARDSECPWRRMGLRNKGCVSAILPVSGTARFCGGGYELPSGTEKEIPIDKRDLMNLTGTTYF